MVNFQPKEKIVDPLVHKQVPLGAIVLARTTAFPEHVRTRMILFKQPLALAINEVRISKYHKFLLMLDTRCVRIAKQRRVFS